MIARQHNPVALVARNYEITTLIVALDVTVGVAAAAVPVGVGVATTVRRG